MSKRSNSVPPTRAQWTDDLLRAEILSGELAPGDRVQIERLADSWGVSPTPIRESVRRLAGEGLLTLTPQRGARVASLDAHKAAELYAVRLLLEPVAIRQSIEFADGDSDFVVAVESAFAATLQATDIAQFHQHHRDFHLAVISRCPNAVLLAEVHRLHDLSRLFQAYAGGTDRESDPSVEHRQLLEAVVAGDSERAVRVQTDHLTNTMIAIQKTTEK